MNIEPEATNEVSAPESPWEVAQAMQVFKDAMRDDPDFAHGWHCNIAMMCYDAIRHELAVTGNDAHRAGNNAAKRFMKLCFDVDTEA